ncbi:ATP-dependent RNA helicase dbp9 [Ceratobasidium sp. AG-Ba]|nr:ATP-dependent RNA helicase dbp9 [Ceratobasidium sp. AG-Ba]
MTDVESPAAGVSAKDFSGFTTNQAKIEANITKDQSSKRLLELITTTEDHLSTANSVIENATTITDTFKITKQVVNSLLAPAKDLADLLSAISDIHPAVTVVVNVFKAILKLEMDRQENDRQIAVLFKSMSDMLIVLAYLDDVFARKDSLQELLDMKLEEIVKLINEFGNFCDVYYKHRSIVRFLKSAKYKETLTGFAENFGNIKQELNGLVSQRTAATVHNTSNTVDSVAADVSRLVTFMEIQTNREREAAALVKSEGGLEAVLTNDLLLVQVAQKLGDQVNSSVRYTLRQDLTQQLQDNYMLFDIKVQAVQEQISETVNRSTAKILMAMDAGPHELIHDPDIKHIWKGKGILFTKLNRKITLVDMKWRSTVKCRNFVSAVHHHFEQMFIRYAHEHGSPHPDLWTLNYMSRVIFYPAIGDAIDEDSSGYVSLHELNHFFDSRPNGWTVPQWIAYWAAGWYRDNIRYRDKIMSRLSVLEGSVESMHAENKEILRDFVESIKYGIKQIVESLYDDTLDYFDDRLENTELDVLRIRYTGLCTKEVEDQLARSKYELDDKRMLMLAIGSPRLESRLFCLMHRLLKRHHKMFDIGKDKPLQPGVTIAMHNSWQVIFDAFVKRMRSLTESWRQQRMDIKLQAQWYANGLFEDWYKIEQDEPEIEEEYNEELSDDDVGTEQDENELVEYATRPPTALDMYDSWASIDKGTHGQARSHEGEKESDDSGNEDLPPREEPSSAEANPSNTKPELGRGSSFEPWSTETVHRQNSSELEKRISSLEDKVDDMRGLMMRILGRLERS